MTSRDVRGRLAKVAERRLFLTLDMLRGLAAVAVVGRHLNGRLAEILPSSNLAVDLFFVLSGFVLAHAYEGRLSSDMSVMRFLEIRTLRLYPLYILGTALGAWFILSEPKGHDLTLFTVSASLLLGLVFLPSPAAVATDHFHAYTFNYPAWSLIWELLVNMFYAAIARHLTDTKLALLLIASLLPLGVAAYAAGGLDGGSNAGSFWQGGCRVGYSFFMGVAVYRLWQRNMFRFKLHPALAGVLLVSIMAFRPDATAIYDWIVVVAVFPLLVVSSTREPTRGVRACAFLGAISYPIYALHAPFLHLFGTELEWPMEVAVIAGLILLSTFAGRFYDEPVRKYLTRAKMRLRRFG